MNVIQWRKEDVSFCGGTGFFKTYESFMLLRAIIVMQNELFEAFSQSFQVTI